MLTQTKEVRDAWRASQRTLDIKVAVNGKTYTATDINSLKYDSGAYTGDTFAIGSTYSNNVQIEFSHLVEGLKLGMEVHPSIGIKTSKGYIYEPLGIFIISSEIKMDRNNNLTSISASDRFCGLEGTYKSKLVYPAKVLDIVAEICAQSGVKANADDLARLPHQADIPIPISGQSYRKALGWIAQLYAGYATFDRQGLFTIRTIAEPNYELDPSQYEQAGLTKNEAPYKIGGIQCQTVITTKTRDGENTEETKTYQVGDTSGSQIKLENNIMTPDRLNNIWEQIKDISFYPFNLNWFGNPAIEAGDWLRLEDKQGNKFIVPNNSYTLDFNGGLSATSKADQTSSTDSAISWRGTYAQIIEELQARKAPDGTVIFPPSVAEPPKNAKPNDVWFKQNGNSTELWVFTVQEDGSGKWIRRDLTPDEIKKQVQEAQNGLNDAKKQIADNLAKADGDIAELNASIRDQKKAFDTDIDELNASIRDQKKAFDTDIDELNASIRDQKGTIDGLSTTINTVAIPKITDVTNKVSDALTKINDQKNIVTGLQTQSAQQGKDISKITTDIHGVSVDLANLNGDVNQTKVTVQGLQSTLGNAQGDIAQIKVDAKRLETSLSGKVDNSTYANFVNQTNQALNAKLVASDLNGYAKTTDVQATAEGLRVDISSVTDRMNNLKIGSVNQLRNTDPDSLSNTFPDRAWRVDSGGDGHGTLIDLESKFSAKHGFRIFGNTIGNKDFNQRTMYWNGGEYVFTVYIRLAPETEQASATALIRSWNYTKDVASYLKTITITSKEWHKFSIEIDSSSFYKDDCSFLFGITGVGSLDFAEPMLVTGNVASDWSPNPDDLTTQVAFSELVQTVSGLQSTVSGNYGGLQSQISQTAQAIHGELSNQITGVQNQITATANGLNARIDNIRIGGRNLLRGTSDQWRTLTGSNWLYGTTATDMWTSTAYYRDGAQFTYSATITNTSEVPVRLALYCYDNDKKTVLKKAVGPTVGPNSRSIHTYVSITIDVKTWFLCSDIETLDGEASTFSIQVKDEQLEEGNVRTAWTTNPDDIASQFTEVNATINGLKSTVSGNYGTLNSQISQTAKTIRQEVSDKTNGLQTQINQQANNFNVSLNSLRNETAWQKVTSAIDANNYKTTGNYWIQAVPNSNTPDSSAWAYLQVVAYPDVKRIKQTWQRDNNENEIYTRLLIGDNWTSWQRTVTGGNIMAQINMSAGTTLIQNDKIYMDASSTVFSGKAFIPDAAITNISADKINTGTLDAGRINVINLNANNITTGTINGANLKIDLNSGNVEFQRGRIHSSNNLLDINIDENYISTANWGTRALLKNGELQLTQPNIFDTNNNSWYFRLYNGGGTGDAVSGASLIGRDSVTVSNKANSSGAMGFTSNPIGTADFSGLFTGKATTGWLPTILGGANRGIFIKGGTNMSESHNILDPNDGGVLITGSPFIAVGATGQNVGWWGNRIVIEGEYLHSPTVWRHTTGSAPNVFVSRDGALVRSTSASKYKTDIKRSYSTEYGEKLLNLPTAIWTDKGQKERYEAGKRHIKPEKYFGMIAEDLADAGLDLLVSRNPLTHEIEGIQYERIAPALLPVIKELKDKVNKLEKKVNE